MSRRPCSARTCSKTLATASSSRWSQASRDALASKLVDLFRRLAHRAREDASVGGRASGHIDRCPICSQLNGDALADSPAGSGDHRDATL